MTTEIEDIEMCRQYRGERASVLQIAAADPNYSVWVEASAGTGKTKVLSDRVLRLLLDGVNPMRILCLTYTKAAAVEMNNRISERLSKWTIISDDNLAKELQKLFIKDSLSKEDLLVYKERARTLFAVLLDTPGGIKIQTIHSFCQEVLKRFPLEAGITPYFDILDDASSAEALKQIRRELLNEYQVASKSICESMQYLIAHLKENSFADAMRLITAKRNIIADFIRKSNGLDGFLQKLALQLQIKANESANDVVSAFMQSIDKDKCAQNIEALRHGSKTDFNRAETLYKILDDGLQTADFDKYRDIFLTGNGEIRKTLATKEAQKFDEDIVLRMENEAQRVFATAVICQKTDLYAATKAVFTIAGALNDKYEKYKQQHAKLDYDDLILITKKLLSNSSVASWVLFKLDGGIDHILLDEAQDTSPDQWEIVKSLSEEFFAGLGVSLNKCTIFAVGDRKQSIYSFQGADPEKFDMMAQYFAKKIGNDFKKVNLEVSFRSTKAVLDVVNRLFSKKEVAEGVVSRGEVVNHLPFRAGEFGHVEIWPLFVAENDKDKVTKTEVLLPPMEMKRQISARTKLAQAIAIKIKQMVEQSKLNPHKKTLHYSDFMVLVQRRLGFVTEFIRACKAVGVQISGADKLRLSEQIAVQDLISLGQFLLLPNDDLALAEVLKSPLFNLTDDDLLELCYNRKGALLWSKLGDDEKYADIYKELQTLANMVDFVRPFELYNYVLNKLNGRLKFIERMGPEVADAIDEFINQTITFEQNHIPSMQNFISWMSKNDIEIKRENEQNDADVVRIMTVHGSKGLQAPIVFLPDTISFRTDHREMDLLYDNNNAYFPLNGSYYEENCLALNEEQNRKNFEEYKRLLYVALTRAEDQLFICGYSNKKEEDIADNTWYKMCKQTLAELSNSIEDKLVYESFVDDKQESLPIEEKENEDFQTEGWVYQNAVPETALSKPYTPSKPQEDETETDSSSPLLEKGNFYRRGEIIHKILQFIPNKAENIAEIMHEFLDKNATDLSSLQREQIAKEVLSLLKSPEFSELFGNHARNEVPIIGEIDGKIISAQIDKLVVLKDKIIIVDYKTNRPAAKELSDTPEVYIKQIKTYAKLVSKIYPSLPVKGYILWTNEARLMQVI